MPLLTLVLQFCLVYLAVGIIPFHLSHHQWKPGIFILAIWQHILTVAAVVRIEVHSSHGLYITIYVAVHIAGSASIIIADGFVMILTWLRTYRAQKDAGHVNIHLDVTSLLLRDGEYLYSFFFLISVLIETQELCTSGTIEVGFTAKTSILTLLFKCHVCFEYSHSQSFICVWLGARMSIPISLQV